MKIYKEGDKSKGPCYTCEKLVNTTFRFASYKYQSVAIPDILQGFCDECGDSVSIPHQSSDKIKSFREQQQYKPIEIRVPKHFNDILISIGSHNKISVRPNRLCRLVSELYLSKVKLSKGNRIRRRILESLDDNLAKGKSDSRLSYTLPYKSFTVLHDFSKKEKKHTTTIIKGIIITAKHDLLDNENPSLSKEFEDLTTIRL